MCFWMKRKAVLDCWWLTVVLLQASTDIGPRSIHKSVSRMLAINGGYVTGSLGNRTYHRFIPSDLLSWILTSFMVSSGPQVSRVLPLMFIQVVNVWLLTEWSWQAGTFCINSSKCWPIAEGQNNDTHTHKHILFIPVESHQTAGEYFSKP